MSLSNFQFPISNVIPPMRQVARQTVPEFAPMEKRLEALHVLKDERQNIALETEADIQVKKLLESDPFFGRQEDGKSELDGKTIHSIGYMNFCRTTLLELIGSVNKVEEIGEKHKDRDC